jgi:hypothetical protein
MSRLPSSAKDCAHSLRGLATILLTLVYMLVGGLHICCDKPVATGSTAGMIVSMSDVVDDHAAGKSAVADQHCHGCFAISMPASSAVAVPFDVNAAVVSRPYVHRVDATPQRDTPPPKFLS